MKLINDIIQIGENYYTSIWLKEKKCFWINIYLSQGEYICVIIVVN